MFKYIFNRLKERSTRLGLIGLIALVTACGATISTVLSEQLIAAGIVTKDKKAPAGEAGVWKRGR